MANSDQTVENLNRYLEKLLNNNFELPVQVDLNPDNILGLDRSLWTQSKRKKRRAKLICPKVTLHKYYKR